MTSEKKLVQPVVRDLAQFDRSSGSLAERILFNHRGVVLGICLLITIILGYEATKLRLNASFEKAIPTTHPYIANYLKHQSDLNGISNTVRIAVETTNGTIYDAAYLETLQKLTDDLFLLPGVDRAYMKSLWSPGTRWAGITEQGFEGGPVIPEDYNGSPESVEQVRRNVERSGEIGQLVAANQKSSIVVVPLLSKDPQTGERLDYGKFSESLEALRRKYQTGDIKLHITGSAKVLGDLIAGLRWFMLFFAAAILIDASLRQYYIRCWRSTLLMVACSLLAVLWQLGLLPLLGFELDPYSVLVPFLIFSIGMSHGSQKMNGVMQDIGRGTHKLVAARYTFRRLFLPGLTALLADAVGFAVLMLIHIQVIRDLAITASIGVVILIFTNLILLPILLSYSGVNPKAAERSLRTEVAEQSGEKHLVWRLLDLTTRPKWAAVIIGVSVVLAIVGYFGSLNLKIGDLDPGAPELRASSPYNRDSAFVTTNYGASSDLLAILVETPDGKCGQQDTIQRLDNLEWRLRQTEGVESTKSLALLNRQVYVGYSEGNPKWYGLPGDQSMINTITANNPWAGLYNDSCSLLTLYTYLKDHKADTLTRVVSVVEDFGSENNTEDAKFLLGAGTAGIDAATNIVVKKANHEMLLWVYGAVSLLCLITFRSVRAVIVAVLPLMLTSVLCEALMVQLGMGVKVATLPVIALGVGIGVDYALYMLTVILAHMRAGRTLSEAYYATLCFTGRVVILTGLTLAFGVATWAFSPIKFQADVGVLLVFMFVWNMLGALILLPALACFLLKSERSPARETVSRVSNFEEGRAHRITTCVDRD
ncbi:MAG TPA: MMPL family transporter [Candidatus Bathyarchaeia archaeon]|nr:MMPL family transporter [Candidatus Bathyarchaeia archaeon]